MNIDPIHFRTALFNSDDFMLVLRATPVEEGFDLDATAPHFDDQQFDLLDEQGRKVGFGTGSDADTTRGRLDLDFRVTDANVANKISSGTLTGATCFVVKRGRGLVPQAIQLTDRPVRAAKCFKLIAGGTLTKRAFAKAAPPSALDVIKAIHQQGPRPYRPGM
jgi:hypothetical protein